MTIEAIRSARIQLHKMENAITAELKNGGSFSTSPDNRARQDRIKWLAGRLKQEVSALVIIEGRKSA
ncbi:hypothetical protein [Aquamicrobium sp.]|uniref:hypothetical protein n=1 Tax=Aquamicrobium sp. TaxID=1872579 RepID=UPI00258967FF|nr:hypothetical protein [Aquamicrobium sp.]MCK9549178.1 hypothetical protein [Aquamicrobium sp.]